MSRIWVNATQLPQLLLGHWNSEPILDGKCFWDSRFTITQAQKELRKHHLCDETHQSDGGWFSEIPRIKPGTLIFILPWGTLSPCWTFMDQAIEFMSRSSFSRKLTQCIALRIRAIWEFLSHPFRERYLYIIWISRNEFIQWIVISIVWLWYKEAIQILSNLYVT
jgi:hypothetical protein